MSGYAVFMSIMIVLGTILFSALVVVLYLLSSRQRDMLRREETISHIFTGRSGKIPALIEIMRAHSAHPDAFKDIIGVYTESVLATSGRAHDILEYYVRLGHEIEFLMRLSMRMHGLQRDRTFLYIRDFIIFSEGSMRRELELLNRDITTFNRLLFWKDCTLIGFLVPIRERIEL